MLWECDCCSKKAVTAIAVDPPPEFHITELTEVGKVGGVVKRFIWCDDCLALVTGHFGGIPPFKEPTHV